MTKLKSTSGKAWAIMSPFRVVNKETGETYLWRLRIVQTPFLGIYLHIISGPDPDRHLHNHPWDFWSFILWGGYTEFFKRSGHIQGRERHWGCWSLHKMYKHNFHQINRTDNGERTWSLVITGRRKQVWGFLIEDEPQKYVVPFYEYSNLGS